MVECKQPCLLFSTPTLTHCFDLILSTDDQPLHLAIDFNPVLQSRTNLLRVSVRPQTLSYALTHTREDRRQLKVTWPPLHVAKCFHSPPPLSTPVSPARSVRSLNLFQSAPSVCSALCRGTSSLLICSFDLWYWFR